MQPEATSGQSLGAAPHPLAELLACPPETGNLLNASAQCVQLDAGETVFRQTDNCEGLYVVVSGQFVRKAERKQARLTLGSVRVGELVELAAALGDRRHTYTLTALTPASLLMLPIESLNQAFQTHPPLRMQLLEELAREVSRAYNACRAARMARIRRTGGDASSGVKSECLS
ncbi:MAG: Crp/Fnr family transcriptional regulator [Acidobacteriota bacterium]|nr:Crp/Fnr family transcriptional regulator [Acidobacteriota bacterium]